MRAILRNVVFLFVHPRDLAKFCCNALPKEDYRKLRLDLYVERNQNSMERNTVRHIYQMKKGKRQINFFYIQRWGTVVTLPRPCLRYLTKTDEKVLIWIILNNPNIEEKFLKEDLFRWACKSNLRNVALIHILKHPGEMSLSTRGLNDAIENNCIENVKTLLKDVRVDPSFHHGYALCHAADKGHKEIVALLLEHPKVYPSTQHNAPLKLALQKEFYEIAILIQMHPKFIFDDEIKRIEKRLKLK